MAPAKTNNISVQSRYLSKKIKRALMRRLSGVYLPVLERTNITFSRQRRQVEDIFSRYKEEYHSYLACTKKDAKKPDQIEIRLEDNTSIRSVKERIDRAIKEEVKTICFSATDILGQKQMLELINYASQPGIISALRLAPEKFDRKSAERLVTSKLRRIELEPDAPGSEEAREFIEYFKKRLQREQRYGPSYALEVRMSGEEVKINARKNIETIHNRFVQELKRFGFLQRMEFLTKEEQYLRTFPCYYEPRINMLRQRLDVNGLSVLELGCFEGEHSRILHQWGADKVIAVEGRAENIEKAERLKEEQGLNRCVFLPGDVLEVLKGRDERFDLCLAMGILYHLEDPVSVIYRVGQIAQRLFIWTHYSNGIDALGRPDRIRYGGRSYKGRFLEEDISNVRGGLTRKVFWMFEEDLIRLVREAGFDMIELLQKERHQHGPVLTIYAEKSG